MEHREKFVSYLGIDAISPQPLPEDQLELEYWWWRYPSSSRQFQDYWQGRIKGRLSDHFDISGYVSGSQRQHCLLYEMMTRIVLNNRLSSRTYLDQPSDLHFMILKDLGIPSIAGKRDPFDTESPLMPWPNWNYDLRIATDQEIIENFKRYLGFARRNMNRPSPNTSERKGRAPEFDKLEIWDKQRLYGTSPGKQAANLTRLKKKGVEALWKIALKRNWITQEIYNAAHPQNSRA